jgi:hypothetical protein
MVSSRSDEGAAGGVGSAVLGGFGSTLRHGTELSTAADQRGHRDRVGWVDGQDDSHETGSWGPL